MSDTTPDHPTDEQFLLASAYLDRELDASGRASVEGDPALMALVDLLGGLQDAVADVEPPGEARRAAAIGAAMSEFTSHHRPAAARPAPPAVASPWGRYLAMAAAVVAVLGLGAVAVRGLPDRGSDDMATTSAESDQAMLATEAYAVAGDSLPPTTTPSPTAMAPAAESASEVAADTETPEASTGATSDPEAASRRTFPAITDPSTLLHTPEELGGLGMFLAGQEAAGQLTTPETSCTFDAPTVAVLAEGRYAVDGVEQPVLIAVDGATGQTLAVDPQTCAILVTGPVP